MRLQKMGRLKLWQRKGELVTHQFVLASIWAERFGAIPRGEGTLKPFHFTDVENVGNRQSVFWQRASNWQQVHHEPKYNQNLGGFNIGDIVRTKDGSELEIMNVCETSLETRHTITTYVLSDSHIEELLCYSEFDMIDQEAIVIHTEAFEPPTVGDRVL